MLRSLNVNVLLCAQDFVDLVIGWMVDECVSSKEGDETTAFCSGLILELRGHFAADLPFATTLTNQILEDMDAALKAAADDKATIQVQLKRVLLLAQ
jgi:hypothetical protein